MTSIHGIGPINAALIVGEIGPSMARFTTRGHFATWNGTAPLDYSSGEVTIHRLSRCGNRKVNHALHMAAIVQIRHDTPGRTYYQRKYAAKKGTLGALRCLKRRISDHVYRVLVQAEQATRAREGTRGRLERSARPPRTPNSDASNKPLPSPLPQATQTLP